MKLILLCFLLLITESLLAQTSTISGNLQGEYLSLAEIAELGQSGTKPDRLDQTSIILTKPEASDSLIAKRKFLTTVFYQNGKRLSNRVVIRYFLSNPESVNQFQWGHVLNPIGPLVSLSGVALGYLAIKGKSGLQGTVRGVGTKDNPNVPDIPVEYTQRNLPELLAGLTLFVGGLCLIELSNELMNKPANTYNATLKKSDKMAFIHKIRLGITPTGNVGLYARF